MIALQKLKWYTRFFVIPRPWEELILKIVTKFRWLNDDDACSMFEAYIMRFITESYGPMGVTRYFIKREKFFNLQWESIVIRIVLNYSFLFLYELWRNIMIDIIRKFWLKCCCQSKTFRNVFGLGRYSKNAHYILTVNN